MENTLLDMTCVILLNLALTEIINNIPTSITLNKDHIFYGGPF